MQMEAPIDQIYDRLQASGVNVNAIKRLNLSHSQVEELCQRIERLMAEARC